MNSSPSHEQVRLFKSVINVRVQTVVIGEGLPWQRLGALQELIILGSSDYSSILRMIRAGIPPTIVSGGTSLLTTAPAATIEFSPTVTPGNIVAPAPIHAFRFITILFKSRFFRWEEATG